jgi:hypothetical protein
MRSYKSIKLWRLEIFVSVSNFLSLIGLGKIFHLFVSQFPWSVLEFRTYNPKYGTLAYWVFLSARIWENLDLLTFSSCERYIPYPQWNGASLPVKGHRRIITHRSCYSPPVSTLTLYSLHITWLPWLATLHHHIIQRNTIGLHFVMKDPESCETYIK